MLVCIIFKHLSNKKFQFNHIAFKNGAITHNAIIIPNNIRLLKIILTTEKYKLYSCNELIAVVSSFKHMF